MSDIIKFPKEVINNAQLPADDDPCDEIVAEIQAYVEASQAFSRIEIDPEPQAPSPAQQFLIGAILGSLVVLAFVACIKIIVS